MNRNSRKICATETVAFVGATPPAWDVGFAAVLLMALGLVALQAIHHARLGYPECKPILHVPLQADIELRCQPLWLFGHRLSTGKLHLKCKLADQGLVLAAGPPQSNVTLCQQPFAEIQLAQRKQYFFDNALVHQREMFFV